MNNEAIKLLRELEWSGRIQGPGTSMGAQNGDWYKACPICRQLEKPNGDFIKSAAGHKPDCRLGRFLKDHKPVQLPPEKVKEARDDLRSLHDPRSLSYNDGYYAKSLVTKWGMSVSDLEALVGRPTYVEKWENPT